MKLVVSCSVLALLPCLASAWLSGPAFPGRVSGLARPRAKTWLQFTIDYDAPEVKELFEEINAKEMDEVEEQMIENGVPARPGMSDIDKRLMLLETRLRKSGYGGKQQESKKSYSSEFERAIYERPAVKALFDKYMSEADHASANVVAEYVNEPVNARVKYEVGYAAVLDAVDNALVEPTIESTKIKFSGFPGMMGEDMVRASLAEFGEIKSLSVQVPDDPSSGTCSGQVEFDDLAAAQAAVDKWNGADMGMGSALVLEMYE
uniref:RRM domain-containing protein n=1 Tax=Rhizochromulina marina TaxID=1034831 RepID=A0A7S2RK66_9STRA|mmetsp:Transcript_17516/g.51231  ORF Transcript_17516/g.51231 Transcript_17516/m.51231 type:complete len:262 (+) Transcript_17516:64-849(+)